MPTLFYFYRTKKKNTDVNIRVRFRHGKEIECYGKTQIYINTASWSRKKQKAEGKNGLTEEQANNFNGDLQKIEKLVLTIWNQTIDRNLSEHWLQNIIDNYYGEKERQSRKIPKVYERENLLKYMDRYGEEIKNGTRLNLKKQRYSSDTVKSRLNSYKVIKEFIVHTYSICDFEDVDIDFYNRFVDFLNEKKYSPQTSGKHIKALKEIINASRNEGYHNNISTTLRTFKTLSGTSDTIYLTTDEVRAIENVDLTAFPDLQLSRDIFLCGIYTAQRYSDYSRINESQIIPLTDKKKAIKLTQLKTGVEIIIPISTPLDNILKKYGYTLPKTYSQKLNDDIKNIAYLAKITHKVEHREQKGTMIVKSNIEKYKLITSHTARRTGATLLYLETRDTLTCMKLTGHKTEKEFLKYIRVTAQENAIMLSDLKYFS